MKIGVFDSGKGGMTILKALKERLPVFEYKYIADSKNCPYGEKNDDELFKIVDNIVDNLSNWGAQIIVIACNTATTRCISHLRKKYPKILFVGTEPAVRLAVNSGAKKILILSTPGTATSKRLEDLINSNLSDQKIDILACPGLASAIENNRDVDLVLSQLFYGIDSDYEAVILGCTHYPLIKDRIQNYFPKAKLFDGVDGVVRRVEKLVSEV